MQLCSFGSAAVGCLQQTSNHKLTVSCLCSKRQQANTLVGSWLTRWSPLFILGVGGDQNSLKESKYLTYSHQVPGNRACRQGGDGGIALQCALPVHVQPPPKIFKKKIRPMNNQCPRSEGFDQIQTIFPSWIQRSNNSSTSLLSRWDCSLNSLS